MRTYRQKTRARARRGPGASTIYCTTISDTNVPPLRYTVYLQHGDFLPADILPICSTSTLNFPPDQIFASQSCSSLYLPHQYTLYPLTYSSKSLSDTFPSNPCRLTTLLFSTAFLSCPHYCGLHHPQQPTLSSPSITLIHKPAIIFFFYLLASGVSASHPHPLKVLSTFSVHNY